VVPARSSRRGHLLARGNHAAVARKIHLSRLFSFPEPPLSWFSSESPHAACRENSTDAAPRPQGGLPC
jgi:hypothetical protein